MCMAYAHITRGQSADGIGAQQTLQAAKPVRPEIISWSKARWQEAGGTRHRSKKTAAWMQADPDRVGVFEEVPSGKVATTAAYEEHLQYRLQHLPLIKAHFCCKQYRRLRWSTYRKRQSAMMQMCNAIADNQRDTIVGYGDARFNSTGPTVSLRRRLRTYCTVYDVDEFRTSKLCCACHQAMTGMTSSAQESDKRRRQRDYGVRLCSNTECIRMMWNRDVNAAINILELLMVWIRREVKPFAFRRIGNLDPND